MEEVEGQVGMATTAKECGHDGFVEEEGVEASQKIFNQVKQKGNMTQATVNDCMERRGGGQGDV